VIWLAEYAAIPTSWPTNLASATASPWATRLARPFLAISIASIPLNVRHAVHTEPKPLASHLRHLTVRWSCSTMVVQIPALPHSASPLQCALLLRFLHRNWGPRVLVAPDSRLSERVLFPATPSQSNGIEDAALFHLTANTARGGAVENKGMALFPRKIRGQYAMLSRQDYENIYVMFSDHLHFWHSAQLVLKPSFPWEFVQLGNCGSPIETEAGWLVLSHGVGPLRTYCIGAFLLDRDDPSKVIGRLREPLIKPTENEREGYVPNVVYSCGSLLHGRRLIVPYGMSDYATTFATLSLDEVLAAME
jgi:glycosyl hydrolase family 130 (putative beta-1,4-mannooligosaccharide phosphorylase)